MSRQPPIPCLVAIAALLAACGGGDRARGPLDHEAYVWQRAWTADVVDAVQTRAPALAGIVVLAAEVAYDRGARSVVTVDPDWSALATLPAVGLALRVGAFSGEGAAHAAEGRRLAILAKETVARARAAGIEPTTLQLDFDAAERRLTDYARWLAVVRAAVDVPLTITALPAWLPHDDALGAILDQVDGWVLQVHGFERPASIDAPMIALCDPLRARRWIEAAARFGRPFRVALPTYTYDVGFGPDGAPLGIAAEAGRAWPPDTRVRALAADATDLAVLLRGLEVDRPAEVLGVTWFRLPVEGDRLNWRWSTLRAVIDGGVPTPAGIVALALADDGALADVTLTNVGAADAPEPAAVRVALPCADAALADATAGWRRQDMAGALVFERTRDAPERHLAPGERRVIGWVRAPCLASARVEPR